MVAEQGCSLASGCDWTIAEAHTYPIEEQMRREVGVAAEEPGAENAA
ncbi:MAG TPA: hypothetical protein VND98_10850 [Solirubrobacterales bacterium]|nr:hypothetical protein [Solirubrobacterales bacterium]